MALIEASRPIRRRPGADENAPVAEPLKLLQQRTANAASLCAWQDIRVANQIDIANSLNAHDPDQSTIRFVAAEANARGDLAIKLIRGQVRLVPPISRDHATVCL